MKFYIRLIIIFLVVFSSSFSKYSGSLESKVHHIFSENIPDQFIEKETIPALDSLINQFVKNTHFNGNILISRHGDLVCHRSFGYADFETHEPMSRNSIFQLASVSKQFTAMSIMLLKEQGKLDYDDLVKKYLPIIPYDKITIRHLLNHTAGLPNYMWLLENQWKDEKIPYNDDVIILLASRNLPLFFPPGCRFSYSNTGYMLLASIVERITNEFFSDFVEQHIFKPLEMNDSFIYSSAFNRNSGKRVNSFYKKRKSYVIREQTIHDGVVGDKGVCSTTADLYKWDQALYTEKLVSKKTIDEAFTPLTLKNKNNWHYGFGFRIREQDDQKIVYHFGTWNSYKTCLLRYLNDKNTVIILNNTNQGLYHIVDEIEKILINSTEDREESDYESLFDDQQ